MFKPLENIIDGVEGGDIIVCIDKKNGQITIEDIETKHKFGIEIDREIKKISLFEVVEKKKCKKK